MDNNSPLISIITPSFNSGSTIERAIKSVQNQSYNNWEHIIVDGGSTDNTISIFKKHKHLVWISEKDKGQADAMNKGFKMAKGSVIVYLNADDYFFPDAFAEVIKEFQKGAKFVVGDVLVKSTRLGAEFVNTPKIELDEMLRHWEPNAFSHNPVGYFYIKEVQRECPFNIDNHWTMDLEFLLDAAEKYKFTKINKVLGCFEDGKNTTTGKTQSRLDYWQTKTFPYIDKHIQNWDLSKQLKFRKDRRDGYVAMQANMNAMNLNKHYGLSLEDLPKVSIIMTSYNTANYINKAIDSVINQCLINYELIIIDNASTDNTKSKLKKYNNNSNVKIIYNKENYKQGYARNQGIEKSTGKYIFFVDSDDWIEPNSLSHLLTVSETYKADIVACGVNRADENYNISKYHSIPFACSGGIEALEYYSENKIGSVIWNKLYTRELIVNNHIKFISPYWHEDVIFTLDCIYFCKNYIQISDYYYNYLKRSTSTINTKPETLHLRSYIKLFKYFIEFSNNIHLSENPITKELSEQLIKTHCTAELVMKMNKYLSSHTRDEWISDIYKAFNDEVSGITGFSMANVIISLLENDFNNSTILKSATEKKNELARVVSINNELLNELNSIKISKGWKLLLIFRRFFQKIFPKGSLQRSVLKMVYKPIRMILRFVIGLTRKLKGVETKDVKVLPHPKRKINKKSKKIIYIGHSYHNKTKSTAFLIDYLKQFYEVEVLLDNSWQGDPYPDLSFIDDSYHAVIFFEQIPTTEILMKIKNQNIIFFPMFDRNGAFNFDTWKQYSKLKIINFSSTLHYGLLKHGFETEYVQYFPKPEKFTKGNTGEAFFWQRVLAINFETVKKLLGKNKMKVHIHKAVDPSQVFNKPSSADEKKYEITYSDWFKKREDIWKQVIDKKSIYFAPREYEGIGMSFLEAMARGKGVIAVNNPTMNEYIVDGVNGYLYNLDNPKEINLTNLNEIQKNTYNYMCEGYEKWEKDKKKIIDFIEKP